MTINRMAEPKKTKPNKAKQSQFQGQWLVLSCLCNILLIKHVQAFVDSVSADGLDFFGGWATIDCRM